jgi:hypothetical protein
MLGESDEAADLAYTKQIALARDRVRGARWGLDFAEYFHYVGPTTQTMQQDYLKTNSQTL